MKIRELPCEATTNPNNSVYRVLGSAYEKTSNGFLIKILKNQTQNIITRPDYRLAGDIQAKPTRVSGGLDLLVYFY